MASDSSISFGWSLFSNCFPSASLTMVSILEGDIVRGSNVGSLKINKIKQERKMLVVQFGSVVLLCFGGTSCSNSVSYKIA